jgi:hypothetical protein
LMLFDYSIGINFSRVYAFKIAAYLYHFLAFYIAFQYLVNHHS